MQRHYKVFSIRNGKELQHGRKNFEGLKYLIYYPKDFQNDKKYPVILFLHGAGMRGETTERLRKNASIQNLLKRQDERGYILLAPLCQNGDWFAWMTPLTKCL